jgi:tetratricopeptide (TPR) repeat protein
MSSYLDGSDSDEEVSKSVDPEIAAVATEKSKASKAVADAAFGAKDFEGAAAAYTQAINDLKEVGLPKSSVLLANRSASYLALKRYVPACHDAMQSAEADPTNWKAHWRQGVAIMAMSQRKFRSKQAIDAFTKCRDCSSLPENKKSEVANGLAMAQARLKAQDDATPMPDMSNCAPS